MPPTSSRSVDFADHPADDLPHPAGGSAYNDFDHDRFTVSSVLMPVSRAACRFAGLSLAQHALAAAFCGIVASTFFELLGLLLIKFIEREPHRAAGHPHQFNGFFDRDRVGIDEHGPEQGREREMEDQRFLVITASRSPRTCRPCVSGSTFAATEITPAPPSAMMGA